MTSGERTQLKKYFIAGWHQASQAARQKLSELLGQLGFPTPPLMALLAPCAQGEERPAALDLLWICEPDHSQHALELGSPQHLEVLAGADRCVAGVDRRPAEGPSRRRPVRGL